MLRSASAGPSPANMANGPPAKASIAVPPSDAKGGQTTINPRAFAKLNNNELVRCCACHPCESSMPIFATEHSAFPEDPAGSMRSTPCAPPRPQSCRCFVQRGRRRGRSPSEDCARPWRGSSTATPLCGGEEAGTRCGAWAAINPRPTARILGYANDLQRPMGRLPSRHLGWPSAPLFDGPRLPTRAAWTAERRTLLGAVRLSPIPDHMAYPTAWHAAYHYHTPNDFALSHGPYGSPLRPDGPF